MLVGLNAEPSNATDSPPSPPFYLNIKLMGPAVLSVLFVLVAMGALCVFLRKSKLPTCPPSVVQGVMKEKYVDALEICSGGSPDLSAPGDSFTYFKQNCQNSQQVYMTVKKATPLKNPESTNFDLIPRK